MIASIFHKNERKRKPEIIKHEDNQEDKLIITNKLTQNLIHFYL